MIYANATLAKELATVTLTNDYGMSVEIINFGARIKSIKFPVNNRPTEMTLGYKSTEEYVNDEFYLGATCGRVCNRIAAGKFELNGQQYQLPLNDGINCLHGGDDNFSLRYWQIDKATQSNTSVTLLLVSVDGDQGFPGQVVVDVTYDLSDDNKLTITYNAISDKATPINLTNHAYFNLGEQDCLSLGLELNSSRYLERNDTATPSGKVLSVNGSDFCFKTNRIIGQQQKKTKNTQLKSMKGYDHCFIIDHQEKQSPSAILTSFSNQVRMSLFTDQLSVQLYTGAFLSGDFIPYQGLCLEAQNYPDAINISHFPNSVLAADKRYSSTISYQFENI